MNFALLIPDDVFEAFKLPYIDKNKNAHFHKMSIKFSSQFKDIGFEERLHIASCMSLLTRRCPRDVH